MSTGIASGGIGEVRSFDRDVGLGEIRTESGATYPFHCIAIADGTRSIEIGSLVAFEILAKMGRYEATAIRPA